MSLGTSLGTKVQDERGKAMKRSLPGVTRKALSMLVSVMLAVGLVPAVAFAGGENAVGGGAQS
jgi:hypothetical protein